MNSVKKFLIKEIKINNINWKFPIITDNYSYPKNNDELLNYLAFSFLSIEEKQKIFDYLIKKQFPDSSRDEFYMFFENHYKNITNKYLLKKDLQEVFISNMLDWILIVNKELNKKSINNVLNYIYTSDISFWLLLIKELFHREYYKLNLIVIEKKKPKFKNTKLYEDLIYYQIFSIKGDSSYLYNIVTINKLCKLSKEITSYTTSKLFIELECAFLNNNIKVFDNLFMEKFEFLSNLSIFELLYILEFAVLIKSEVVVNTVKIFLHSFDIEKENKYEYELYSFYELLYNRKYLDATMYILRLYEKEYNFDFIVWYLKKNNEIDSHYLIYVIEEISKIHK